MSFWDAASLAAAVTVAMIGILAEKISRKIIRCQRTKEKRITLIFPTIWLWVKQQIST